MNKNRITITTETRQKFKNWSAGLNQLTKEEQKKEADVWIKSALNILNQNPKSKHDNQKVK